MTKVHARKTLVLGSILALLLAIAAPAFAQLVRSSRVAAFGVDTWRFWLGGGYHRLVVNGDHSTDLDCFVYDRNGTFLGADDDETDMCIVDFRTAMSGTVIVRIENHGSVYNDYQLVIR